MITLCFYLLLALYAFKIFLAYLIHDYNPDLLTKDFMSIYIEQAGAKKYIPHTENPFKMDQIRKALKNQ